MSETPEMVERFFAKVDKRGIDECWHWRGTTNASRGGGARYGMLRVGSQMKRANRLSYEMHCGEIADGLVVRHTCDNSLCVNPKHLETGTQQQNVQDRYERGRDNHLSGESHPLCKIPDALALAIVAALASGESQRTIAKRLGISQFGVRYARDRALRNITQ